MKLKMFLGSLLWAEDEREFTVFSEGFRRKVQYARFLREDRGFYTTRKSNSRKSN